MSNTITPAESCAWLDDISAMPTLPSLVCSGSLSAVELAKASLDRIEALDPQVQAFLTVDREGALRSAETLDKTLEKERSSGVTPAELTTRFPLAGLTVGVKDVLVTKGLRTTCASRILDNYVPPYDAHTIEKLRASGATIVGKTNMDEFAMGSSTENSGYFPTKNPCDFTRTPGGSSGGSAAAVAARMVHLSIGTDTGGSIRQPASFTGCVGLKPTYGRVSRYGLIAYASSLDVVGPMARSVRMVEALYATLAGHDGRDGTCVARAVERADFSRGEKVLKGLRIGVPREYFTDGMEAETEARVRDALATLVEAGAHPVELSMPHTKYGIAAYYVLASAEASSNLARFDGVRYGVRHGDRGTLEALYGETRERGFGAEVKRRILLGTFALSEGYYDAFYGKAQRVRTLLRKDFTDAFEKVDVLLAPTAPTVAFPLGARTADPLQMYLEDVFTLPASLAGVPCMSLPCGKGRDGLPVGLQLLARPFEEARLLSIAHAAEALLSTQSS